MMLTRNDIDISAVCSVIWNQKYSCPENAFVFISVPKSFLKDYDNEKICEMVNVHMKKVFDKLYGH